jgi:DNA-binding response OmpR family regulator
MGAYTITDPPVVLIAEDDDMIADLLALVVEQSGATSLIAPTLHQALTLARARCPALLIAESKLLDVDGAALIAAVRAVCGAGLPTILLASVLNARVRSANADAVLPRPFPLALLRAHLTRLLPT